jgi:cytochrome b561
MFKTILLSHEIFFWTSVNLMGLHIIGAFYHRLRSDGVWNSMVPILKEKTDI